LKKAKTIFWGLEKSTTSKPRLEKIPFSSPKKPGILLSEGRSHSVSVSDRDITMERSTPLGV